MRTSLWHICSDLTINFASWPGCKESKTHWMKPSMLRLLQPPSYRGSFTILIARGVCPFKCASLQDTKKDRSIVRGGAMADKPGVGKTIASLALCQTWRLQKLNNRAVPNVEPEAAVKYLRVVEEAQERMKEKQRSSAPHRVSLTFQEISSTRTQAERPCAGMMTWERSRASLHAALHFAMSAQSQSPHATSNVPNAWDQLRQTSLGMAN